MQVKAFSQETAEDLEHEIGAWLGEHPAITIVTAVQSMGRSFANDRIVLTLFYTEPTPAESSLAQQLPRPAMVPPSSGMGRASPLSPGAAQQ